MTDHALLVSAVLVLVILLAGALGTVVGKERE